MTPPMTDPDLLAEIKARQTARQDWWVAEPPPGGYGRPGAGHCRYCGESQAGADWETGDVHKPDCPAASEPEPDIDWLVGEVERLREERGAIIRRSNAVFESKDQRLRELLARLEWIGDVADRGGWCPACYQNQEDGHEPDCWLAAELRTEERPCPPS